MMVLLRARALKLEKIFAATHWSYLAVMLLIPPALTNQPRPKAPKINLSIKFAHFFGELLAQQIQPIHSHLIE